MAKDVRALREEAAEAGIEITPQSLAGHSAGQYAAAVAANAIDYADAVSHYNITVAAIVRTHAGDRGRRSMAPTIR